ncbi:MAG: DUF1146 family protein [Kurthia gibsonii]|uniref:DUF1146 family protein n=1 Tax=Kurthia gibsonii TaxID=33946 RepID=A0ABU9LL91_9BACL|nr:MULTISPECIES: DUF1146 family protein [Kurthia]MCA9723869.1 DUF1146 family protein [Kurthia sp.]AMA62648.1 hypothetical protein ASO14_2520 [Kurthia sp. 11kri321]MEB6112957.1 DUF1146 family protein [Kurthia gibsonii]MEB7772017.1 DUF1146 family protein [Kurthia gibsonii]RXH50967.1 DUF1146 domain-containing protein [Kurthia gibsonii]
MDSINATIGTSALLGLISHIFFIGIAFYSLQSLMYEQIFKKGRVFQIQLLLILVSIALGTAVSNFFLQFLNWSRQLQYLF